MNSRFALSTVLKTVLAVLSVVIVTCVSSYAQDVPHKVSYQGLLTDVSGNTPIADATYNITVTLYADPTGSTAVWSSVFSVKTDHGIFNIILGDLGKPLPTPMMSPVWLGVKVEGGVELTPLTQVVAAPYALGIADSTVATAKIQDNAVTADKIGQDFLGRFTFNQGKIFSTKGHDVDLLIGRNLSLHVDTSNGQVNATIDALGGGTLNDVKVETDGGLFVTARDNNSVTLAIANQGVQEYMIRNYNVTNIKLADGAVDSRTILDNSITGSDIASNTITGNNLKNNTITGQNLSIPLILQRDLSPGNVLTADNSFANNGGAPLVKFTGTGGSSDGTQILLVTGNVTGADINNKAGSIARFINAGAQTATTGALGIDVTANGGPAIRGTTTMTGAIPSDGTMPNGVEGVANTAMANATGVGGSALTGSPNAQYGTAGASNATGAASAGLLGIYAGTNTSSAAVWATNAAGAPFTNGSGYGVRSIANANNAVYATSTWASTITTNTSALRVENLGATTGWGMSVDATGLGVRVGSVTAPTIGLSVNAVATGSTLTTTGSASTGVSITNSGGGAGFGVDIADGGGTGVRVSSSVIGVLVSGSTTGMQITNAITTGIDITAGVVAPTGISVKNTGTTGILVSGQAPSGATGVSVTANGSSTGISSIAATGSAVIASNAGAGVTGTFTNTTGGALSATNAGAGVTAAVTNTTGTALTATSKSTTATTATFQNQGGATITLPPADVISASNSSSALPTISATNGYSGGAVGNAGVARFTNANALGKQNSTMSLGNSIGGGAPTTNYALVITDGLVDFSSTATTVLAPNLAAQVTVVTNPTNATPANGVLVTATGIQGAAFASTATAPNGLSITNASAIGATLDMNSPATGIGLRIGRGVAGNTPITGIQTTSTGVGMDLVGGTTGITVTAPAGEVINYTTGIGLNITTATVGGVSALTATNNSTTNATGTFANNSATGSNAITAANTSASNATVSVTNNNAAGDALSIVSGKFTVQSGGGAITNLSNSNNTFGSSTTLTDATKITANGTVTTVGVNGVSAANSEVNVQGDLFVSGTTTSQNVYVLGNLVIPSPGQATFDKLTVVTTFNSNGATNIGDAGTDLMTVLAAATFTGTTNINVTGANATAIGNSLSTVALTSLVAGTTGWGISTAGNFNTGGTLAAAGNSTLASAANSTTTIGSATGGAVNVTSAAVGGITLLGATNINVTGAALTTIGNSLAGVNIVGIPVNVNTTGSGVTNIGTSGNVIITGPQINLNNVSTNAGSTSIGNTTSGGVVTIQSSNGTTGVAITAPVVGVTGTTSINTTGSATTTVGSTATGGNVLLTAANGNRVDVNVGTSTAATNIGNSGSTTTVLGPTNINTSGSANTTIGNGTVSRTTILGPTDINVTGTALTQIGILGGSTNIGASGSTNTLVGATNINFTGAALTQIGNNGSTVNIAGGLGNGVTLNGASTNTGSTTIGNTTAGTAVNINSTPATALTTSTGSVSMTATGTSGAGNIGITAANGSNVVISGGSSTAGTNIGNASSTTTVVGPTSINLTAGAATQIGNASSTTTVLGPTLINAGTSTSATTIGNTGAGADNVSISTSGTKTITVSGPTNINSASQTTATNIGNASSTTTIAGPTNINTAVNNTTTIGSSTSTTQTTTLQSGANSNIALTNGAVTINGSGNGTTAIGTTATGGSITLNTTASNLITNNGNTTINGANGGTAALTVNGVAGKQGIAVNGAGTQPMLALSGGAGLAIQVMSNNDVFLGGLTFPTTPAVNNTTFVHNLQIDGLMTITGTASLAVNTSTSPAMSGVSSYANGIGVRGVSHPGATSKPGVGVFGMIFDNVPADGSPESSSNPITGVPNPLTRAGVYGYTENDEYFGGVFTNSNKLNPDAVNQQATALQALALDNTANSTTGRGIWVTEPNVGNDLFTGIEVSNTNSAASEIKRALYVNSNGGVIDTGLVIDPVIYGIDVQAGTAVTNDYGLRIHPTVMTTAAVLDDGIIVEGTNQNLAGASILRGITINADAASSMTHGMRIGNAPSVAAWGGSNAVTAPFAFTEASNAPTNGIDIRFIGASGAIADPATSTTGTYGVRANSSVVTAAGLGAGFVAGDVIANTLREGANLQAVAVGVRVGTQYDVVGGTRGATGGVLGGVTPNQGANITVAAAGTGITTTTNTSGSNNLDLGYEAITGDGNIRDGINIETQGIGTIGVGAGNAGVVVQTDVTSGSTNQIGTGVLVKSMSNSTTGASEAINTGMNITTGSAGAGSGNTINTGVTVNTLGGNNSGILTGYDVSTAAASSSSPIGTGLNVAAGSLIGTGVSVVSTLSGSTAINKGVDIIANSATGTIGSWGVNVQTTGGLIPAGYIATTVTGGITNGLDVNTTGASNILTGVRVNSLGAGATAIGTGIDIVAASALGGINTAGVNVQTTGGLIPEGFRATTVTGAITNGVDINTTGNSDILTGVRVNSNGTTGTAIGTGVDIVAANATGGITTAGVNVQTTGGSIPIGYQATTATGGIPVGVSVTTTGATGSLIGKGLQVNSTFTGGTAITTGVDIVASGAAGAIGTGVNVSSTGGVITDGMIINPGTSTTLHGVTVSNVNATLGTGFVATSSAAGISNVGLELGTSALPFNTGEQVFANGLDNLAAGYGAVTKGGIVVNNNPPALGVAVSQAVAVLATLGTSTSVFGPAGTVGTLSNLSNTLAFTDFSAAVVADATMAAGNERAGLIAVSNSPIGAPANNNNRAAVEAYNTAGGIAVSGFSAGVPIMGVTTGTYPVATGLEGYYNYGGLGPTDGVGMVGASEAQIDALGTNVRGAGVLGVVGEPIASNPPEATAFTGVGGVVGTTNTLPAATAANIGVLGLDYITTVPSVTVGMQYQVGVYGATQGTVLGANAAVLGESPDNVNSTTFKAITNATGTSYDADVTKTGIGLTVNNLTDGKGVVGSVNGIAGLGRVIDATNNSADVTTAAAIFVTNTAAGDGIRIENQATGEGIRLNNTFLGGTTVSAMQILSVATNTITNAIKITANGGTITNGITIDPVVNGIISASTTKGAEFTVTGGAINPVGVSVIVDGGSGTNTGFKAGVTAVAGLPATGADLTVTSGAPGSLGTGVKIKVSGGGTNTGIDINTAGVADLKINENSMFIAAGGTYLIGNPLTTTDATNLEISTPVALLGTVTSTLTLGSNATGTGVNPGNIVFWDILENAGLQNKGTLGTVDLTADHTWNLPDMSGIIAVIPPPAAGFVEYGVTDGNTQTVDQNGLPMISTAGTKKWLYDVAYAGTQADNAPGARIGVSTTVGSSDGLLVTSITTDGVGGNSTGVTATSTSGAAGAGTSNAGSFTANTAGATGNVTGVVAMARNTAAAAANLIGLDVTATNNAFANANLSLGVKITAASAALSAATGASASVTSLGTTNTGFSATVSGGTVANIGVFADATGILSAGVEVGAVGAGAKAINGVLVNGGTATDAGVKVDMGLASGNQPTGAATGVDVLVQPIGGAATGIKVKAFGAASSFGLDVDANGGAGSVGIRIGANNPPPAVGVEVTHATATSFSAPSLTAGVVGFNAAVTAAGGIGVQVDGGSGATLGKAIAVLNGKVTSEATGHTYGGGTDIATASNRYADTRVITSLFAGGNTDFLAGNTVLTIPNNMCVGSYTVLVTLQSAGAPNYIWVSATGAGSFTISSAIAFVGGERIHYMIINH